MPATSVRDLIVKDDDLAVATHGRGFWILDNITPLRQLKPTNNETLLFKPQTALRVRWNFNTDTPLPPDEPVGENPPEGAMIDYSLGEEFAGPVTLEIKARRGGRASLREHRSGSAGGPEAENSALLGATAAACLSDEPGMHRFFWDLHGEPLPEIEPNTQ